MQTVALHNLGCKVNSYEIEFMQQNFEKSGYEIVPFDSKADIYIVNTCTVTNIADRKSRQMLHRAKRMNPDAVVVATGCYVQTDRQGAEADESIDLCVGNNRKADIVKIVEEYINNNRKTDDAVIDVNDGFIEYEEMTLERTAEHVRAYIKIQDGCNQFCTYCAIPYSRGRVRSRKKEQIIDEIRGLASQGYKEFVLTGIHISSYGLDFVDKEASSGDYLKANGDKREVAYKKGYLIDLIKDVSKIDGVRRIRIGSLEPRIVTEEFAKALSEIDAVCPHFHLSLQSGSDTVLKRMNRHYSAEEYLGRVEILRKYFDNPAITTDIITGFPGETKEEFEETRQFACRVKFYETHIFRYSPRKGTIAAGMPDQIDEQIKAKRSDVLLDINAENSKKYREMVLGRENEILIEEKKKINGKYYMTGHTKNYIMAAVPEDAASVNDVISGMAESFLTDEILLLSIKK
ncbi:MAG: tRNA (N(6)-L-threonylcarbamoyladenosine(37)-C(2))-methylthiotransferase MtaB [Lachnospiraceae bacterium]|nr:tRNA (N(6)-L-threonylcarbamoyladenosine(37)-C(2))-methylthiotransferase MtaB [Candidatus Colinaster scatohippi]